MPWEKQFDVNVGLDKAMQVFWERGYDATSIQDLVERTGINRGSLYATYGDKRALFLAALRRYDETIRRQTLAELEEKLAPREAIRRVFEVFAEPAMEGRPARGCLLVNCALELAPHDREVSELVANSQRQIEAFFMRSIAAGQMQGEISTDLDPTTTARGLLASLQGLIVFTRSRPEAALLTSVIEDAMRRLS
jgi:TetR/AcrR family transcriptional repressor of nem operon